MGETISKVLGNNTGFNKVDDEPISSSVEMNNLVNGEVDYGDVKLIIKECAYLILDGDVYSSHIALIMWVEPAFFATRVGLSRLLRIWSVLLQIRRDYALNT